MALDFNNRDPKDPNGIYSLDTSSASAAWVKDADWSTIYYSESEAKKAGATNKVKVATAITNEGKKYNVVLNQDGQPISQVGDTTGTDDDVSRAWQRTAPKPLPPGAAPTQRQPDGTINSYNPATGLYDTPTGQTAVTGSQKPPGSTTSFEGTPTGQKDANGKEIYDNTQPRVVVRGPNGNVISNEPATGADLTAWQVAQERSRNGGKTDAEARADRTEAQQTADRNKPTVKIEPNASGELVAISIYPDGHTETKPTGVKGTPQQVKGPDGNTYERQADGSYALPRGIPNSNAPYTGPKLPQIVLGHSAEALQALGDQLARDPSLTPAQREKMWGEAVQTANVAVAEAGVLQRERESNLNAQVNLATTRQKAEADAFTTALKYATDLNDKLPAGSPLGGQAFAAMLGMQMISAHRSGLYDIKPPGTPVADAAARPAPAPAPTLVNPGNRAAVEAQRQEVAAQTAQVAQQRSAPPSVDAQVGNPNVAPTPPTSAAAPALPPPTTAANAGPVPGQDAGVWTPPPTDPNASNGAWPAPSSQPGDPSWNTLRPGQAPAPSDWETDDVMVQSADEAGQPIGQPVRMTRAEWEQLQAESNQPPAPSWNPLTNLMTPTPPKKEYIVTPVSTPRPVPGPTPGISVPVAPPSSAGAQSMAPPSPASEFAALAPYMPPQQPAAPQAAPSMDLRQSPALLHAQAASKPPWRMSPEELAQYEAAGVPEDVIYSVPGRQVA